jgi:hypothetical protein
MGAGVPKQVETRLVILPSTFRTAVEKQAYVQNLVRGLRSPRLDLNISPLSSPESSRPSSPTPAYSLDLNEKKEEEISDLFFNGLRQRHRELCGSKCNKPTCIRKVYFGVYRDEGKRCPPVRMPIEKDFGKKEICMHPECSNLMLNPNKWQKVIANGIKCVYHSDQQMKRMDNYKLTGRTCEVTGCTSNSELFSHYGICSFHKKTLCKCSNKIVPWGYLKLCSCVLLPEDIDQ